MKKLLPYAFAVFVFVSCSKKDDVNPDVASEVAGTYQATRIEVNGQSADLPQPGVTVGIKLTKKDLDKADFQITTNLGGAIAQDNGEVTLIRSGSKINLKVTDSGKDFGHVEGKNIALDFISDDGSRVKLNGNRL